MVHRTALSAAALLAASFASAQTVVHGILESGDVIQIDPATGHAVLLGRSGAHVTTGTSIIRRYGDLGTSWTEALPFAIGDSAPQVALTWISPCTGQVSYSATWTIQPGSHARAAANDGTAIYLVEETPTGEVLAHLDVGSTQAFSIVGPTGRGDLVAIAKNSAGSLYALGTDNGGALYTLDPLSGAAALVGACAFGDARSLAFLPDGKLLACGANLMRIDPATGGVTIIGATGFSDIRALTVTPGCAPPQSTCYVNCDGSWNPPPILNVQDFNCFLLRFSVGDPYANCDGSTASPFLNVNDFVCFLNRFAGSC